MSQATAAANQGVLAGRTPAAVIEEVEARRGTARIHFETEVGDGQVDMIGGLIVDAFVENLIGRPALFSLLGAHEGRFEIREEALEPRPALVNSVAELLRERDE